MRKRKIQIGKVQKAFNRAVVRRDGRCMVRDGAHTCGGVLQCSHFLSVGACNSLRFYPPNAWTMCARHHMVHHHRDELFYRDWIEERAKDEFDFMRTARYRTIKYTQDVLEEILAFCKRDDLDGLREFIREKVGY